MRPTQEVQQRLDEVQSLLEHRETGHWESENWGRLQRGLRLYEETSPTLDGDGLELTMHGMSTQGA
jgi:hypothetical protein